MAFLRAGSRLQKANARGADLFELFSNSPMWWQCADRNPSGAADGEANNLPPSQYRRHAVYLAAVAAHAERHWGVSFASAEAFNEPSSDWWVANGTQEVGGWVGGEGRRYADLEL